MSTNNLSLAAEFGKIIQYWLNLYHSKVENCMLWTVNNIEWSEVEAGLTSKTRLQKWIITRT